VRASNPSEAAALQKQLEASEREVAEQLKAAEAEDQAALLAQKQVGDGLRGQLTAMTAADRLMPAWTGKSPGLDFVPANSEGAVRIVRPNPATFVAWRKENKMPDVVPFLTYEDGIAALEWLAEVFGFTEAARFTSSDGRLSHGEMSIGDGLIMLASPSPDYEGPKRHRDNCEIAASWSALPWIIDGVLVYVEDVDEHYARAKAGGAAILSEPEDGPPARRYRVEDLEGHRWMFMARH
jgi:PhnB protein